MWPVTKASIEAMPRIVVTEEDIDCSICLEDNEDGGEAREMPCMYKFHSGCIEKWFGIHGSFPICRFLIPVEEENKAPPTTKTNKPFTSTKNRLYIWYHCWS